MKKLLRWGISAISVTPTLNVTQTPTATGVPIKYRLVA